MCGIVGKLNFNREPIPETLLRRMCAVSLHRGPDDEGIYRDDGIGLGHRRLSIIDVAGGHQPMSNEDGTVWVVFNGEIYNFQELRAELKRKGHFLRTQSDTEVIVHLYEEYGTACLNQLNGMFAFAIWDQRRQRLILARDRLGQKPLHYSLKQDTLTFASEIQPILEDSDVARQLNLVALDQYLSLLYVPTPLTMLEGVMKLPPAHYLLCEGGQVRIERYWQLDFDRKLALPEAELQERLLALLDDATRLRLISEVPLGAFLSGGLDSSLVVALMNRHASQRVKTFSVGFETQQESWLDELPYARLVAQHLDTDHTELICRPELAEVLPDLVWHYGEPFGDNSSVPTYYLCKATRSAVTVALSGDGGDELFAGYAWHQTHQRPAVSRTLRRLALTARKNLKAPRPPLGTICGGLLAELQSGLDPIHRYASKIRYFNRLQKSRLYTNEIKSQLGRLHGLEPLYQLAASNHYRDPLDRILATDTQLYLPDDILVKVDIASMASSLEVRSPFLDYRVVEFAASLPSSLKLQDGISKRILKRAARDLLPAAILDRPKWGFGLPVHDWMRQDLGKLSSEVLLDRSARSRELFSQDYIQCMLASHESGQQNLGHQLWLLLNFELWSRTFLDGANGRVTL